MDNNFKVAFKVKVKNGKLQEFIGMMNWNQSDFARHLGFTIPVVGRWFNMRDFPRTKVTMDAVCDLLGESASEIFPHFLRDPDFIKQVKAKNQFTKYVEVPLTYLGGDDLVQMSDSLQQSGDLDDWCNVSDNPTENIEKDEAIIDLQQRISKLGSRESSIIKNRFGLKGNGEKTLKETAEAFDLSKERIRQIESKGLRKMKKKAKGRDVETKGFAHLRLQSRRLAYNMTQQQLAVRAGFTSGLLIERFESGKEKPTLETTEKLADALGCKTDFFNKRTENQ